MLNFPEKHLQDAIKTYLGLAGKKTLALQYESQEPCSFLLSENAPTKYTIGRFLEPTCNQGYVIADNSLFYLDKSTNTCEKILTENPEIIRELKQKLCFHFRGPYILSRSQLVAIKKLSKHQRQSNFCCVRYNSAIKKLEFSTDEGGSWNTLDARSPMYPVIANLYPSIEKYNQEHTDLGFRRNISRYLWPSKKIVSLPQGKKEKAFRMPEETGFLNELLIPFNILMRGFKSIFALLFLNNVLIKQTVGRIIAAITNHGNPHYQTRPETVSGILGPIIFPGGFNKPQVGDDGTIRLDNILSKQYYGLYQVEKMRDPTTKKIKINGVAAARQYKFAEFSIPMENGYHNYGIEGTNTTANNTASNKIMHVLCFTGNSGSYQDNLFETTSFLESCDDNKIPVKFTGFNYPSVLSHDPSPPDSRLLVEYGIAQVKRLLEQGCPPENIIMQGPSLGGSVASHVAGHYLECGVTLGGLSVSRTFSSTSNVGLAYVNKVPYIGSIMAVLLRPVLATGLWGTNWKLDTAKHFSKMPEDRKTYTFARTPRQVREIYADAGFPVLDDDVIAPDASLHSSWRLRIQRVLQKHMGLHGVEKTKYRDMNAARKLVATLQTSPTSAAKFDQGILAHQHCAHADIDSDAVKLSQTHGLQLLTRKPATGNRITSVRAAIRRKRTEHVNHIPVTTETAQSSRVSFLQFRAEKCGVLGGQMNSGFHRFFTPEPKRSTILQDLSNATQFCINLVP